MSTNKQVILITGASTGFGRLAAQELSKAGHTVYAGQYSHDGNTAPYEQEIAQFSKTHSADLRPIPLNLLSEDSVINAVQTILSQTSGVLNTIIHNAGHMGFGPAEAFTCSQFSSMYEINVIGCQRLNQAILPHMRSKKSGHIIWISSSSVYGAKSPMLAPYFAAKAAMDSLAQSYSKELHAWGIETTIVSPGVFTKGTNHFSDAAKPGVESVLREYEEGPTKGLAEQTMTGTAGAVPDDADPIVVAEELVKLAALPRGEKPFRVFADPAQDNCDVAAPMVDRFGELFYKRMGLEKFLKVWL
ncbi:D-beta-hydroxybutyrate dehydrogenase, mitochondrial [Pseudocercospora fuligena]|uniref:D-beta-hydroxybutyrate dehydrogenase, mitochondrial n=1 Tax=Pseudocercospora fuligena TaxID=685502 RepID=A0A8H6VJD4_9PEZI|nr:D-beta-hydroxybutyrate dehydrogenase, mitochondrial [Pseudocercospora fuligena]